MNGSVGPWTTSSPRDIASSSELAEISRLLNALRQTLEPSLRDLSAGSHRTMAREVRRQSRCMPTSALRASVHRTLQLLDTRPPVDPQGYAASRRRLGTLMSRGAVADDWIAWLQARQRQARRLSDTETHPALDAEIQMRKEQRRRLIDRDRHAELLVQEHERRLRALYNWQLNHLPQLVQGRWHAQELLDREERALDEVVVAPPPYLVAGLGAPPQATEGVEVWRRGALAILRFRKDYHIQDPDRVLGEPSVGGFRRLRRGPVEAVIDQVRQLIHNPVSPFPWTSRSTSPTSVSRDQDVPSRRPGY